MSWPALAVIAAILAGASPSAFAQDFLPPRGGDVRSGGNVGGDVRRGGVTAPGIGVGVDIGVGIGQEILRQQQPTSKGSKSGRGTTTKNADNKPPRTTQQVWEPLVYRMPGTSNCHDCDELLALILKYQALIAADEKVLADLTQAKADLQGQSNTPFNLHLIAVKDDQIDGINKVLNGERDFLRRLLDQYKECVKKHCPQPPKRHLSIVHVDNALHTLAGPNVDCGGHKGKIVIQTGVDIHWDREDAHPDPNDPLHTGQPNPQYSKNDISISYQGSGCDDCVWVQFVWTEYLAQVKGEEKPRHAEGAAPLTTSGNYNFTSEPEHPNYNVDTSAQDNPAYEAAGTSNVDANSDTIFDRPGNPFNPDVNQPDVIAPPAPFNDDLYTNYVTRTWIDHYDTFLVCNGQVCGEVSWQATYTWQAAQPEKVTGPDYKVTGFSSDGKPNVPQYQALTHTYGLNK